MEEQAVYHVKGQPDPPRLEKTIIYVEAEELQKLKDHVGPYNQRTKEGGMSAKVRELIKLYNMDPDCFDALIEEKIKE